MIPEFKTEEERLRWALNVSASELEDKYRAHFRAAMEKLTLLELYAMFRYLRILEKASYDEGEQGL